MVCKSKNGTIISTHIAMLTHIKIICCKSGRTKERFMKDIQLFITKLDLQGGLHNFIGVTNLILKCFFFGNFYVITRRQPEAGGGFKKNPFKHLGGVFSPPPWRYSTYISVKEFYWTESRKCQNYILLFTPPYWFNQHFFHNISIHFGSIFFHVQLKILHLRV